jgi:hypothetical protein
MALLTFTGSTWAQRRGMPMPRGMAIHGQNMPDHMMVGTDVSRDVMMGIHGDVRRDVMDVSRDVMMGIHGHVMQMHMPKHFALTTVSASVSTPASTMITASAAITPASTMITPSAPITPASTTITPSAPITPASMGSR